MKKTILARLKEQRLRIAAIILSVFIGGFTAINLGQDINYDLLNYHYYNPYAFIHDRYDEDFAPAQLESYTNPIVDLPAYLLISHSSPRITAGVLGMVQGLNIWLIFEIARIVLRPRIPRRRIRIALSYALAVLSFFGAASLSEAGNTMGDNITSIFILSSLLLLLVSAEAALSIRKQQLLRLSAFFTMGIAMGFKLTSAVYGLGLLAAGLLVVSNTRNRIKWLIIHGAATGVGMLVSAGFWYWKLWDMFKNPIFPFYNAIFDSPYYPEENFVDKRWPAESFGEAFLKPFDFLSLGPNSVELAFRDPRITVLYVLVLILIIALAVKSLYFKRNLLKSFSRAELIFWVFIILSYVLWAKQFGYYRYLMSIELLSLLGITSIILILVKKQKIAYVLIAGLVLYITIQTSAIDWGRVNWRPTYFGITQANFTHLNNSTVLIAGHAPLSFIVPYMPPSSQTIRVDSDLSSPDWGTPKSRSIIQNHINAGRQNNEPFYALVADEDKKHAKKTFISYGFAIDKCDELAVHIRENIPSKFRLCNLKDLQK